MLLACSCFSPGSAAPFEAPHLINCEHARQHTKSAFVTQRQNNAIGEGGHVIAVCMCESVSERERKLEIKHVVKVKSACLTIA